MLDLSLQKKTTIQTGIEKRIPTTSLCMSIFPPWDDTTICPFCICMLLFSLTDYLVKITHETLSIICIFAPQHTEIPPRWSDFA